MNAHPIVPPLSLEPLAWERSRKYVAQQARQLPSKKNHFAKTVFMRQRAGWYKVRAGWYSFRLAGMNSRMIQSYEIPIDVAIYDHRFKNLEHFFTSHFSFFTLEEKRLFILQVFNQFRAAYLEHTLPGIPEKEIGLDRETSDVIAVAIDTSSSSK